MDRKPKLTGAKVLEALRAAMKPEADTRDALGVLSFMSGYLRCDAPEISAELDRVIDRDLERGEFARRSA